MKIAFLCVALFGLWFWQRPQGRPSGGWPESMPVFAGGVAECAYETRGGGAFVSVAMPGSAGDAAAAVRAAFSSAGWSELPVRTRDMLMFTRDDAVAAVLAQDETGGVRITAVCRTPGL